MKIDDCLIIPIYLYLMSLIKHILLNKAQLRTLPSIFTSNNRFINTSYRLHSDSEISFVKKHNTLSDAQKEKIESEVKEKTGV